MGELFRKLFLGPGQPNLIRRQGWRRGRELLTEEWNAEPTYGIVRLLRLILHILSFASLTIYIDTFADWIIHRRSRRSYNGLVDGRVVAIYREVFYVAQVLFLIAVLR